MKFLFVSPSLKLGGIERALIVLANYFSEIGHEVIFVVCLKSERFYSVNRDIKLIEPRFTRNGRLLNKGAYYFRLLFFIRKEVIKNAPDYVIAFGDLFSPLVLLALYRTKFPVYISDRTHPEYRFHFPIPFLKRWLYPKSAGFIAQTLNASEYKKKKFGGKLNIRVIPNGIREIQQYEIPREKIILYVGRLAWEKGPDRLIKAFANIDNRQGWTLLIAGSGPMLNQLKTLGESLGLRDEIKFLGKVKNVDILYSSATIFVLPSIFEGFPNSLCEAMAAGLPCICFDTIPFQEIVIPGVNGLVVSQDNIAELSRKMAYLMNNEEKRNELGENAQKIREKLKVTKIGQEILDFILAKYQN